MVEEMPRTNDFMVGIVKALLKKGVAEPTALLYLNNLHTLNNKKPFTNLSFLKKKDDIQDRLSPYAESTRRTYLSSVVSVLGLFADKPTYKKLLSYYQEELANKVKEDREKPKNTKTEKQQNNWIDLKTIEDKHKELADKINDFQSNRQITTSQWNTLLNYFVLTLFTAIQPRRNQDYHEMEVVKEWKDTMPTDKNYLCLDTNRFIFNKYKTAKKYGQEIIEFEDKPVMKNAVKTFLKFHPLNKGRKGKNWSVPLLISFDGSRLNNSNAITRILNRIFKGKKVGSSMLRHIYLTSKYGDTLEEMEEDAKAMGHSLKQQKEYIKNHDHEEEEEKEIEDF